MKSNSSADRDTHSTARNLDLGLNLMAGPSRRCRNYRGRIPEPFLVGLGTGMCRQAELTHNRVVKLTAQTTRSLHVRPSRGLTGSDKALLQGVIMADRVRPV